jgi:hypothetical protein
MLKYLKKTIFYIIDPLNKLYKHVTKTQTSGEGNQYRSSPSVLLRKKNFGFPCDIGAVFFTFFVLFVFSKKMYMYIVNKYLSTPKQNFCYWVWEALKLFNQIWGVAGSNSLRSADLKEEQRLVCLRTETGVSENRALLSGR